MSNLKCNKNPLKMLSWDNARKRAAWRHGRYICYINLGFITTNPLFLGIRYTHRGLRTDFLSSIFSFRIENQTDASFYLVACSSSTGCRRKMLLRLLCRAEEPDNRWRSAQQPWMQRRLSCCSWAAVCTVYWFALCTSRHRRSKLCTLDLRLQHRQAEQFSSAWWVCTDGGI